MSEEWNIGIRTTTRRKTTIGTSKQGIRPKQKGYFTCNMCGKNTSMRAQCKTESGIELCFKCDSYRNK
jgi:transcription elongation factor Elf1